MIKIKRKKDFLDLIAPYQILINGEKKDEISWGKEKHIELEDDISYIQFKFQYFKSNTFMLKKGVETNIKIGSFSNLWFFLLTIPVVIIAGTLMTLFPDYEGIDLFYNIAKYIALFYMSVFIYMVTIGHKKYFNVDIDYTKND